MKKLISYILMLNLVFSVITPVKAINASYSDVKGTVYSEVVTVLEQLGMIEAFFGDVFNVDSKVSRGDFAIIFAKVIGYDGHKTDNNFSDIDSDTELSNSVNYLANMGIVSGVAQGVYSPDEPMTLEMVQKCIIYALGYNGPTIKLDYLKIVSDLKLNRGISSNTAGGITRGDLCILIYNAFDAHILEIRGTEGNSAKYVESDETFAERYCGLKVIEDVVEADSLSSIIGERLKKNYVRIGGEVYLSEKINTAGLTGHYVKAFVTNDERKQSEIKALYDKSEKISVMYDDIIPDTSKSIFCYFNENDKKKAESISSDVYVVYNGVPIAGWDEQTLMPEYGNVELIKFEDEDDIRCIFVWDFEVKRVKHSLASSEKLIFDDGSSLETEKFNDCIIINQGEFTDITAVSENAVVMIAESGDKTTATLFFELSSVSGVVSSTTDEEIFIDGNPYKTNVAPNSIKAGDRYIFYLDIYGRISFYDINNELMCGYLVKILIDDSEEHISMRIFNENGSVMNYQCADRVGVYNGKHSVKSYEEVEMFNELKEQMKEIFVQYKTNALGEINVVYLPEYEDIDSFGNEYFTCNVDSEKMFQNEEIKSEICEFTNGYLYIKEKQTEYNVYVNDTTKIFYVAGPSETEWKLLKASLITLGQSFPGMKAYNINEFGIAEYILIKSSDVGVSDTYELSDPMFVFERSYHKVNDDKEVVSVLKGVSNIGGEIEFELKEDDLEDKSDGSMCKGKKISELKPGDIVHLKLDVSGKVIAFTTLYECEKIKNGEWFAGRAFAVSQLEREYIGRNKENLMFVGPLISAGQNMIVIKNDYLATKRAYSLAGSPVIARFDTEKNKVKVIEKSELYSGAAIFAFVEPEWLKNEFIVLYE